MSELAYLPAVEQAALVRTGAASPVELTERYLARIEQLDPQLNAYVTVCADGALAAARDAAGRASSDDRPFHGVPISVKDLTETAGVRTTLSSRAFAEYVPAADVAVVRRLREAGFVLLGKTNTCEFGTLPVTESRLNGPCRNPWDTSRNAGGSSGGAAAALAAGLCPIAHGNDGGGSLRIPASCCGVVGLKPSRGRVSHAPYAGFAGLSSHGPIARTVRDAAALLDVMAGYETGDAYWLPPPERPFADAVDDEPGALRVAVTVEPPVEARVDPACAGATERAGELLQSLGHAVERATPAWRDDRLVGMFMTIWQVGSALYPDVDPDDLEPLNRDLARSAHATSSVDYALSLVGLHDLARRLVAFWDVYDVLVTPTLAMPPVPVGWLTGDGPVDPTVERALAFCPFTQIANITGQPAVSLPLGSSDGLPIGVQFIGRPADDTTVIRLAAQLERARPWAGARPPVA